MKSLIIFGAFAVAAVLSCIADGSISFAIFYKDIATVFLLACACVFGSAAIYTLSDSINASISEWSPGPPLVDLDYVNGNSFAGGAPIKT